MLHLRKDQILCDKQGCQVFRNFIFQMDPLHFCKLLISFSDILFHSPFVSKVKVERLHFFPFLFHCKQTFFWFLDKMFLRDDRNHKIFCSFCHWIWQHQAVSIFKEGEIKFIASLHKSELLMPNKVI